MATWFKDTIDHIGDKLGLTIDKSIQRASSEIQGHIDTIGDKINTQRSLTKEDIQKIVNATVNRLTVIGVGMIALWAVLYYFVNVMLK